LQGHHLDPVQFINLDQVFTNNKRFHTCFPSGCSDQAERFVGFPTPGGLLKACRKLLS
jgi:hypothetical protein